MFKIHYPAGYKPEMEPRKSTRIEYWYDRSLKLWTIIVKDEEGNQIGEAEYDVRISDVRVTLDRLKKDNPKALVLKG